MLKWAVNSLMSVPHCSPCPLDEAELLGSALRLKLLLARSFLWPWISVRKIERGFRTGFYSFKYVPYSKFQVVA